MKAFLVNLDRNPERLAFMQGQAASRGVAFERVPAVDGRIPENVSRRAGFSPVRSFIASKKRMSDAEKAVAMSHVECCRRIVQGGHPCALVLEDDVSLLDGFADALRRVEAFLDPARAQAFLLSGYGVEGAEAAAPEIRRVRSAWCADAYVLTAAGAAAILRANDPVVTVADSFKRWSARYGLEVYRVLPSTARQEDAAFPSENKVLPKTNFVLRNLLWVADWILWKAGR